MANIDDKSASVDEIKHIGLAKVFGIIAAVGLAFGCFVVIRPFVSALLWASILTYSTWPAYRFLTDRLRFGRNLAAFSMVFAEFILLGLPLTYGVLSIRGEVGDVQSLIMSQSSGVDLNKLVDLVAKIPFVGEELSQRLVSLDVPGITGLLSPYAGNVAQAVLGLALIAASGLLEMLLSIFLAFFLYRDGVAIAETVRIGAVKLIGSKGGNLIQLSGSVTRGVVFGLLGTSIIQGLLTAVGLWAAGVPRAAFLSVIAAIAAVTPIGPPLIWGPAVIWLLTEGQTLPAILLAIYGIVIIGGADNIIRPWFISRGSDTPIILPFLGAMGGVLAFGFLGLFLGPVLLALGLTILKDWCVAENT
jgi:predicted PurR-regulated permease PerM